MTTTLTEQPIPTGTWWLDTTHSSVAYAVRHSGVSLFRGGLTDFDATVVDGELRGSANVASITVQDESLQGHLLSPEFFDAERHPEVRFTTDTIRRNGDDVEVDGQITIKGITQPATLHGTIVGPSVDHFGKNRVGLSLETTVDRTAFDINWNMPLPNGDPALANEVTLKADLTLVGQAS